MRIRGGSPELAVGVANAIRSALPPKYAELQTRVQGLVVDVGTPTVSLAMSLWIILRLLNGVVASTDLEVVSGEAGAANGGEVRVRVAGGEVAGLVAVVEESVPEAASVEVEVVGGEVVISSSLTFVATCLYQLLTALA